MTAPSHIVKAPADVGNPLIGQTQGRVAWTCASSVFKGRRGLTRVQAPGNRAGGEPLLALSWLLAALEFGPGVGILDQSTIEIVVLAFIAGFVLFRLYATLGRRTGAERPVNPRPQPAHGAFGQAFAPAALQLPQAFAGNPAGEGVMAIVRADPSFDIAHFMAGAKGAYEIIVGA